jgi:hypothetical protein
MRSARDEDRCRIVDGNIRYSALQGPRPPPSQRTTVGTVPDRQAIPQLFWRDLWTPRRG